MNKSLVFKGNKITPFDNGDGKIWFTNKQLSELLGYKDESSVTRIFNRNKDEFTDGMSQTVNLTVSSKNNEIQNKRVRIFSVRGAHLVGILSKTEIAKALRRWLLDLAEKESKPQANATANAVSQLETKVTEVSGKVTSTAQQVTRLESQVGTSSAKIEQTSKVVTDINGKISASWTMKVQQDSKGNKVITGIGLGFNAQGNSQFLVNAQNFAVISSLNGKVVTPFVIQNGQAFFNDALFSKATIDKLSVGKKITSTNYLAGKKGFNIDTTTGNVELNDAVFRGRLDINSGGTKGRLVITNNTIYVYDENNQLAAKIGYLG